MLAANPGQILTIDVLALAAGTKARDPARAVAVMITHLRDCLPAGFEITNVRCRGYVLARRA